MSEHEAWRGTILSSSPSVYHRGNGRIGSFQRLEIRHKHGEVRVFTYPLDAWRDQYWARDQVRPYRPKMEPIPGDLVCVNAEGMLYKPTDGETHE